MALRFTAILPTIASSVVLALTIVLLAAGSDPSSANDDYWLSLNTSGIGGNLVTVAPADPSASDPLGAIISSIPGLEPILDNVTQSIGDGLSDIQGQIFGSLSSGLGLKDFYFLYASKMCEGTLRNNDSHGGVNIDSCYSYYDRGTGLLNITNSIPNSFVIGNAQVSVPLVMSFQSILKSVVNLAMGSSTTMMILLIIACIAAGLTAIGSAIGIVRTKSQLLTIVDLGFSTLAATTALILAVAVTCIVVAGGSVLDGIGSGLSIDVKKGSFLAIIWVAAVLSSVVESYWFIVWFVEFRKTAFSRRTRTTKQIGNWSGILGEVRRDIKINGHFPPPDGQGEDGGSKTDKI